MLCMDPHTMQSTDEQPGDATSYRPMGVHTVPMSAIDSTMALGFHCASPSELDALVSQVLNTVKFAGDYVSLILSFKP